jgi:C4-dicarboxylate transporter DctQ subunit
MQPVNRKSIARFYSGVVLGLNYIAAVIVFLMAVTITANVLMRKYLGYNLEWLFDFTQYALVYITFLAGGWLTRQDGHIRVDLVQLVLPERIGHWVGYANLGFSSVICFILFWLSASATWNQILSGNVSPASVPVPNWMIWIVLPVGFFFMGVEFAITIFRRTKEGRSNQENEHEPAGV